MSDEKHAVLEIERARVEALLRHDVAALDRMMAEECVHTENNGTLRPKAQFLAAFATQEFAFASFILEANEVRLYGDTAVVVGNYRNVIRTGSQIRPEKTARHLSVYVKRDGRWLLVAHQATESQKEKPVAQRVESGFSWAEEVLAKREKAVPFNLEEELRKRGANYTKAQTPFETHIVEDGRLITGPNPGSAQAVGVAIVKQLQNS